MKQLILFGKNYINAFLLPIMILGTYFLFLLTPLALDNANGAESTIPEIIINRDNFDFLLYPDLSWQSLINRKVSIYFEIFAPVLCTISVMYENYKEKKEGFLFLERIRINKGKLNAISLVSGSVISGICMISSFLLFLMTMYSIFPDSASMGLPPELVQSINMPLLLLNWFMYGVLVGGFVSFMSAIISNLACCISLSIGVLFLGNLLDNRITRGLSGTPHDAAHWVYHPFVFLGLLLAIGILYVLLGRRRVH